MRLDSAIYSSHRNVKMTMNRRDDPHPERMRDRLTSSIDSACRNAKRSMVSMVSRVIIRMKVFAKRLLRSLGYEIHKISRDPSTANTLPPEDEIIRGPWLSDVLQMANRSYKPKILRYYRGKFGDDQRIKYLANFLDLRGLRTLEIGPLEGYHSVLLEKMGVKENVAIESRNENLKKCRRIKEKYGLDHTIFLLHDVARLYNGEEQAQFDGPFDLVFCLGVLYHVPEPAKALTWFRSQAKRLFLGTHYANAEDRRLDSLVYTHNGKNYRVKEFHESGLSDPLSGMSPISLWPYEKDLLAMIEDVGYSKISVLGKDLQNGHPHITIIAE
jgi:methyltransferase family protein